MARKINEIMPPDFDQQDANFVRSHFQLRIPAKFDYHKDVLSPDFWRAHQRLRTGDLITVISENYGYDCDLRVTAADRGYAMVRPIREWFAPEAAETAEFGEACVRFIPGMGFTLFNGAGEPVSRHPTEDAAEAALAEHLAKGE